VRRDRAGERFTRLSEGTAQSLETSSIHLDTIRDLKQINSLLASMAYPVLEERGLLRGSRLNTGRATLWSLLGCADQLQRPVTWPLIAKNPTACA
jgi:hypothetical protein